MNSVCLVWLLGLAVGLAEEFPARQALTDAAFWSAPEFRDVWQPLRSTTPISYKHWPEAPPVFGQKPHAITAKFVDDEIQLITLLFLDSGTHFGYVAKENAAKTREEHQDAFRVRVEETAHDVEAGLVLLAKSANGDVDVLGKNPLLKQKVTLFELGNLTARLHHIDEQLVKVTVFPEVRSAQTWFAEARRTSGEGDWEQVIQSRLQVLENGDRLLSEIPMFPQGDRAYCGVSSLAMATQYLGLAMETEDLAAAAGIRYGSTKGARILEVYQAAFYELGMRLPRREVFDLEKAKETIDAGIPVIVWRRWRSERDYLHTQFARRHALEPSLELPQPDDGDREFWPKPSDYNHASVITGYNAERGEVIFTESWGERVRNRRMRGEEMKATSYYSFYPAF